MISIQSDPQNPNQLTLTATVTLYLDRLISTVVSEEVSQAIREQIIKDLGKPGRVRKAIQEAAGRQLPALLSVAAKEAVSTIKSQTATGTASE